VIFIVGGIVALGIVGGLIAVCVSRRRRQAAAKNPVSSFAMSEPSGAGYGGAPRNLGANNYMRSSDSSSFSLRQDYNQSQMWDAGSTTNLVVDGGFHSPYVDAPDAPYMDESRGPHGMSLELDPYAAQSRLQPNSPLERQSRRF
jgi:hypothetical protein